MDVLDGTALPPLQPQGPPGRRNLRARAYASQIHQLQQQGYTLNAIHAALCSLGVPVSKSTVQREAALYAARSAAAARPEPAHAITGSAPLAAALGEPPGKAAHGEQRSGRDIAEDFMRGHSDNVFLRARGKS